MLILGALKCSQLISHLSSPFGSIFETVYHDSQDCLATHYMDQAGLYTPNSCPGMVFMGVGFHTQHIKYFLKSRIIFHKVRTRRIKTCNIPLVPSELLLHAIFCRVVNQGLWCTMELLLYSCNEREPS